MAHVNPHTREVSANIVYYGPSGSGKTASLEFIHRKLRADLRGKLTRVPAQLDPTASYELIPVELGEIKGMRTRFQIASVPGDPVHAPTRKALLRDVDGIVFVADSRGDHVPANLESLKDLEENLAAYGRLLADVPIVFQWNRSDQPGAITPAALGRKLNATGAEAFESVATDGTGVLAALTTITKLILRNLRSGAQAPAFIPPEPQPRRTAEPATATFRVGEPPPAANLAENVRSEQFDPRSISRESDLGLGALQESLLPSPPPPEIVIEESPEGAFAEDLLDTGAEPIMEEDLPEASLADLTADALEEIEPSPRTELTFQIGGETADVLDFDASPGEAIVTEIETEIEMEIVTERDADPGAMPGLYATPDLETMTDLESMTDLDAIADVDDIPNLETGSGLQAEPPGGSALDIPMEPFEDTSMEQAGLDALESAFEPLDFAGEVTRLAGRDPDSGAEPAPPVSEEAPGAPTGVPADAWEIVGVGAPTRLGPATFTIPLEISEGGGEARVAEITITLSPPKPARKGP